jgi:hypothetical protein
MPAPAVNVDREILAARTAVNNAGRRMARESDWNASIECIWRPNMVPTEVPTDRRTP